MAALSTTTLNLHMKGLHHNSSSGYENLLIIAKPFFPHHLPMFAPEVSVNETTSLMQYYSQNYNSNIVSAFFPYYVFTSNDTVLVG